MLALGCPNRVARVECVCWGWVPGAGKRRRTHHDARCLVHAPMHAPMRTRDNPCGYTPQACASCAPRPHTHRERACAANPAQPVYSPCGTQCIPPHMAEAPLAARYDFPLVPCRALAHPCTTQPSACGAHVRMPLRRLPHASVLLCCCPRISYNNPADLALARALLGAPLPLRTCGMSSQVCCPSHTAEVQSGGIDWLAPLLGTTRRDGDCSTDIVAMYKPPHPWPVGARSRRCGAGGAGRESRMS